MKTKKNINENIDITGAKWELAPGGHDQLDKCQERLWELHIEMAGYGALFRNLTNTDFSVDELYGVSLVLMRVSKRLGIIHDMIGKATRDLAGTENR
jgi:hypothetical protein